MKERRSNNVRSAAFVIGVALLAGVTGYLLRGETDRAGVGAHVHLEGDAPREIEAAPSSGPEARARPDARAAVPPPRDLGVPPSPPPPADPPAPSLDPSPAEPPPAPLPPAAEESPALPTPRLLLAGGVPSELDAIDALLQPAGEFRALFKVMEKDGDGGRASEAILLESTAENAAAYIVTRPRPLAGVSLLSRDGTLWFYAPEIGRWERPRNDSLDELGARGVNLSDLPFPKLSERYELSEVTPGGLLGKEPVTTLELAPRDGRVGKSRMSVATDGGLPMKKEDFAASGKLVRTTYYSRWTTAVAGPTKRVFLLPGEIRVFDEIERSQSTFVTLGGTDPTVPENAFTKAFVEARSR